ATRPAHLIEINGHCPLRVRGRVAPYLDLAEERDHGEAAELAALAEQVPHRLSGPILRNDAFRLAVLTGSDPERGKRALVRQKRVDQLVAGLEEFCRPHDWSSADQPVLPVRQRLALPLAVRSSAARSSLTLRPRWSANHFAGPRSFP